jgi:hypothetical protein
MNDKITALKQSMVDAVSPYRIPFLCRIGWHRLWGPWGDREHAKHGMFEIWWYQQRRCMGCGKAQQRWVGRADR